MKINENTEKLEISVVIISIEQLKKVLLKVSKIKAMKSVVCVCVRKRKEGEKEKEKEGCKITVVVVVVMAISFFFLFYFYVLPK